MKNNLWFNSLVLSVLITFVLNIYIHNYIRAISNLTTHYDYALFMYQIIHLSQPSCGTFTVSPCRTHKTD